MRAAKLVHEVGDHLRRHAHKQRRCEAEAAALPLLANTGRLSLQRGQPERRRTGERGGSFRRIYAVEVHAVVVAGLREIDEVGGRDRHGVGHQLGSEGASGGLEHRGDRRRGSGGHAAARSGAHMGRNGAEAHAGAADGVHRVWYKALEVRDKAAVADKGARIEGSKRSRYIDTIILYIDQ